MAVVVCDYKGLTHKELRIFKKRAKGNNTKVQVAKNTLVTVAVKNAELGDIDLSGTNIFLWSEDQISTCKTADKFASENKENLLLNLVSLKVKFQILTELMHSLNYHQEKNFLVCLLLYGWDQLETLLSVLMLLEEKKKRLLNYLSY